ncbi:uncharacterized protein, partial [Cicer arietinum]
MVNSTRSSQKAKDEEINNGRVTRSSEKAKINAHLHVSDAAGIRKSLRETLTTKIIASSSSTRKSGRVEKRPLPTPEARRKSERVEKKKTPSPLTRSGRTRNHSSSSLSDSKSSGSSGSSSSSRQKLKKEKSVKQLIFEANEVNVNEEHNMGTSDVKIKRMDARMYRSLFKQRKKDCLGILDRISKPNQEGDSSSGAKIDELSKESCSDCKEVSKNGALPSEDAKAKETRVDSRLSEPMTSLAENNVTPGLFIPSNAPPHDNSVVPKRVRPDCCREDPLSMLVSGNSILDDADFVSNNVGFDGGEKLAPSKIKEITVDMDSNDSSTLSKGDNCNLVHVAIPSRLGGNILGNGDSCSRRIRLDYNSTVKESCDPRATEHQDGDDIEATKLQQDCLASVAKNICLICKGEGQLLSCGGKGCNGYYHLSCLEPPLLNAPLGVWHCHTCVRKKIEFGVHSVSEGVESVWDIKEASFSNLDGISSQKEFLVKYKGLAHVHNRWVPENQLLLEAPLLLMKFIQNDQNPRLRPEWSLPHRLLQKRAFFFGKQHDDQSNNYAVDDRDCCYEWLVKWRGLGYEHATWESDNASFLYSPEGQSLISSYERRFQRAKRIDLHSKLDKKLDRGNSINKLLQMPGGVSAGFGNHNLDAVNKLREYWHKGQTAIVIDDHDRILKVVAFILSLHSDTYRPFLIISTAASLHSWEDVFYQSDPSIDVVIYNGNKEIRNNIRRLEFYGEEQCLLFQVLIVVPEIVIEDIDFLEGIEWEAIVADDCQSPAISPYFKQIRMLSTHLRILLFRGQRKDSIVEDINFLALLDGHSDNETDGLISNSNNRAVQLKEKLSSHIAYRCKSDSFRFVEYWVPVQISNVQLEQYCATLLSNASILCSSPKVDSVGAIRNVLISIRKCCNHPYVIDLSVQGLLTKGLVKEAEILDVGIKASGKLQLLDSMLTELKNKDLRALVLFQSIGGSGKDSIGDILDDFLRQRFESDSYERIDKSLSASKKQAAMKKFNDKNNKRFVFLLETSACLSSIKLSSIDTIIIFDSDWNPMNDIKSLQKITLDSQSEFIKVFRFYSTFTVEEKALILAKQDKAVDINVTYANRINSHMLLMWGASRLFDELRGFHDGATSTLLLEKTVLEFSSIISEAGEATDRSNCSILLKVQQNEGGYCANFPLLGELKLGSLDEESPQNFWTKLLEGKQFQWKYSCSTSQRSRKRIQPFNSLAGGPDLVSEGMVKKRRKVGSNIVDQPSSNSEGEKLSTGIKADRPHGNDIESEKKSSVRDEQRSLYLSLKPDITKLCEVLLLPDNVKKMVDNFLVYVMTNHHVIREPASILQAFQISLTWTAASLLKHKLDHKASLILAKKHLNFDCEKREVEYIYSMMRCLKRIFLYHTSNYHGTLSPKASESSNGLSCTGVAQEVELFKKDLSKSIKEIQKKCEKYLNKLHLKQQEEKNRSRAVIEVEKAGLERTFKIELAFIRSCSPNEVSKTEMLKILNIDYQKRIEELNCQHETNLKVLEDEQSAQMLKFQDWEATWVEAVKSWAQNELLNIVTSKELGTGVDYLQMRDQVQFPGGPNNHFAEVNGHDNMVESLKETGTGVLETHSPAVGRTVEQQNSPVRHDDSNEMDIMVSNDRPIFGSEDHNTTENQYVSQENIVSKHSQSREQNSDGATSMTDEDNRCENFGHGSRDGSEKPSFGITCLPDCREQNSDCAKSMTDEDNSRENSDGVSSSVPEGQIPVELQETTNEGDSVSVSERQVPVEMPVTANFTDCLLQNATTLLNPPSSVNQISERGSLDVPVLDGVLSSRPFQAVCSTSFQDTISLSNPPLEKQIPDGVSLSITDGDIPVTVPENAHAVADCHNKDIEPSTNAMLVDNSTTNDQEEGVLRSMTSVPVSRQVNVIDPLEQNKQLPSVESTAEKDSGGEMQNSSEQVELASSSADVALASQIMMMPLKQVHQLPAAELSSNLATEDEHQPTSVSDIPTHHPEVSSVVPNKDAVQPHSNSELGLHSNQVAVHPATNSDLASLTASRVRAQSSNPRNLSNPLEMNNHPIQTTAHSSPRTLPHLCYDPLKNEFERIQKVIEQ